MKINPLIKERLEKAGIPYNIGVLYLMCQYHELTYSPLTDRSESDIAMINSTKIVERDYTDSTLKWNISLYEDEDVVDKNWDWVNTEFRPLFGKIRGDAIGTKAECTKKMKKYFSEHPLVRKDDVIKATKLYLHPFEMGTQQVKFLQRADYFISKIERGSGTSQLGSRLDMFLEVLGNQHAETDVIAQRNMKGIVK